MNHDLGEEIFAVEYRTPRPLTRHQRAQQEQDPSSVVLGVDDLVLAAIEPAFTRDRDAEYWKLRLRLLARALGVPGRGPLDLEITARAFPTKVEPLSGFLECPRNIINGFEQFCADPLVPQLDRLFLEVQGRFVRAVVDAIDPSVADRSTTLAELIALGLPATEPELEIGDYDW